MKRVITVFMFVVLCAVAGAGQRSGRRPTPAPPPGRMDAAEQAFRQLRELEIPKTTDNQQSPLLEAYRKPSKDDLEILKPATSIADKYAEFLRQDSAGIVKLSAYEKCSKNGEVVSADQECVKYKIPGGGTSYSFRYETYRIPRLSDLTLKNAVLKSDGLLQQGIMVDLGKVPIETVGLSDEPFKYLVNFKPAQTLSELSSMDREFVSGIQANGFLYRLGFYAHIEHTFALRSIAYQRELTGPNNSKFDEFQLDKRHDVIVVFKVVEVDYAGSVTIVWKELSRRDAPKLKIEPVS